MISQEYDRTPDLDLEANEDSTLELIDKLDIVRITLSPEATNAVDFLDYHKMLEATDEIDVVPVCDFGVYVGQVGAAVTENIRNRSLT